jgi:Mn2+/Fe2+ NRAMP family transporter
VAPARETSSARIPRERGVFGALGSGIITGAADDDPSAVGTYASAGAAFGLAFLWIAPILLPMMFAVVYLSAKLGRVYGKGLFDAIRDTYPPLLLFPLAAAAVIGNTIEAAANLGGIGAAVNLLVPLPIPGIVALTALIVFGFQLFGSYELLRSIFRWLALALLAYVAAAILSRPALHDVLRGTLVPTIEPSPHFVSMVVACIGTSLSAYIYTWQSNQEVEEQIADGRRHWWQRRGASARELARTRQDVVIGMLFSNLILYAILVATGATLHQSGQTSIGSPAEAAAALKPLAGEGATWLFAAGIVGVGVLAVPIMTTGAAYDLVQAFGLKGGLHRRAGEAKLFYGFILAVTLLAVGLNMLGLNPIKALVWSGIVQGFSVPVLLFVMMLMTNRRDMMGDRVNSWGLNLVGGLTVAITAAAAIWLVALWVLT